MVLILLPLFFNQQSTFLWTNIEQSFIQFDLILDIIADLQFCLQLKQVATLIEEQTNCIFQSFLIVGSCWNMDKALGENGVFSVHKLVKKHSQRVSIVPCIFAAGYLLELTMVKIRNISSFLQTFLQSFVQRHRLSNLRDSVFKIDIFDVKHVEGTYR